MEYKKLNGIGIFVDLREDLEKSLEDKGEVSFNTVVVNSVFHERDYVTFIKLFNHPSKGKFERIGSITYYGELTDTDSLERFLSSEGVVIKNYVYL